VNEVDKELSRYDEQVLEYAKKIRKELLDKEDKKKQQIDVSNKAMTPQEEKLLQAKIEMIEQRKQQVSEPIDMSLQKEREEKVKAEERLKQEEELNRVTKFIEQQQYGWTDTHKQLFRELCNLVDPKYMNMVDYSSERGQKIREILTKFSSIPLDYGTITMGRIRKFKGSMGMNDIFVEYNDKENTWKLTGDVFKYTPRMANVQLIYNEQRIPIAIQWTTYNDLIPNIPLKVIVKLQGIS
jgi:seryl-tRNA synthetase